MKKNLFFLILNNIIRLIQLHSLYSQHLELKLFSSACRLSQSWTIMAPVSKRRWTSNKIKQHQERWRNEQIVTQVSYSFSQSLPIYGESRYLYLSTYIFTCPYIFSWCRQRFSHSPTFKPFCSLTILLSLFISMLPRRSSLRRARN